MTTVNSAANPGAGADTSRIGGCIFFATLFFPEYQQRQIDLNHCHNGQGSNYDPDKLKHVSSKTAW